MRVAVVAGPDPGHALPALALCVRLRAAGDEPTLLTGVARLRLARSAGIDAVELLGLNATGADDDADAGAKIHQRAGRMAVRNAPVIAGLAPDLVVSDAITACGGLAAELRGLPWVELSANPLYRPSAYLPPIGSGLAPGRGLSGRLRDAALRAATGRSWRAGLRQRRRVRTAIGLPGEDPGPRRRLIATLPALELPRPDWPPEAILVGPLHQEATTELLPVPPGDGPLIVVAPSTAHTGAAGLTETALRHLVPGAGVPVGARIAVSRLGGGDLDVPPWAAVGLGRQDELFSRADVVVCGGGHGTVSKALLAGVPMVVVPGGGDQWEIANRVARHGCGALVRPLTPAALVAAVNVVLGAPSYRAAARRAGEGVRAVADPVRVCHAAVD